MHKEANRGPEAENSGKETKSWPYKTTENLRTPRPWSKRVIYSSIGSVQDLGLIYVSFSTMTCY